MSRLGLVIAWSACALTSLAPAQPRPAARFNHSGCFDSRTRAVLIFGGRDGGEGTERDDALWAWNGEIWSVLARGGPAARSSPLVVCDARRGRVIVASGYSRATFADTWEWNGQRWTRADSGGLPPRAHGAAAIDPLRGTLILFGGFDARSRVLNETWEWNGSVWRKLDVAGPPARYAHTMTTDEGGQRVLLTGGWSGFGAQNRWLSDTWSWTGGAWTKVGNDAPSIFAEAGFTSVPSGTPLLFGSAEQGTQGPALWRFIANRWNLVGQSPVPRRHGHSAVYDPVRQRLVVFGGIRPEPPGGVFADVWEWDGHAWTTRQ